MAITSESTEVVIKVVCRIFLKLVQENDGGERKVDIVGCVTDKRILRKGAPYVENNSTSKFWISYI